MITIVSLWFCAFLLGSIPSSVLLGKWLRGVDVREAGSGNPGATNAFRVLGTRIGTVVLIADILKGALATFLGRIFMSNPEMTDGFHWVSPVTMGVMAILGHTFSLFLRFKGGKGVATSLGAIGVMAPASAGWSVLAFGAALLLSRRVSLGSLAGVFTLVIFAWSKPHPLEFRIFSSVVLLLITWAHRSNIGRLLSGTEPTISINKKKNPHEI